MTHFTFIPKINVPCKVLTVIILLQFVFLYSHGTSSITGFLLCDNPPMISIEPSEISVCGTTAQTFTITLLGGTSYAVITHNGFGGVSQDTITQSTAITYSPDVLDSGNFVSISFTTNDPDEDLPDCESYTAIANLQLLPTPQATVTVTQGGVCGESSQATVTPGYVNYTWSIWSISGDWDSFPGINNNTMSWSYNAPFNVTVTNEYGCTTSLSGNFSTNPYPYNTPPPTPVFDFVICGGNCCEGGEYEIFFYIPFGGVPITPSSNYVTGPNGFYQDLGSNTNFSVTLNENIIGSYTFYASYGGGCYSSETWTLSTDFYNNSTNFYASLYPIYTENCITGFSVNITQPANPFVESYVAESETGSYSQTGSIFNSLPPGTYTVWANTNCNTKMLGTYTVPNSLAISSTLIFQPDDTYLGIVEASGGIPPYTYTQLTNDGSIELPEGYNNNMVLGYLSEPVTIVVSDSNGCTDTVTLSQTVSVPLLESGTNLAPIIYPNPAKKGMVNINLNKFLLNGNLVVSVYSTDGRSFAALPLQSSKDTDILITFLNSLEIGIYLVRIISNNQSFVAKFVIIN